jgi:hypothetical protein
MTKSSAFATASLHAIATCKCGAATTVLQVQPAEGQLMAHTHMYVFHKLLNESSVLHDVQQYWSFANPAQHTFLPAQS